MEVGKGQHQESFSGSFQYNDFDDEDDDDGHFVIALDESGQENDELDDGNGSHDSTHFASCGNMSSAHVLGTSSLSQKNGLNDFPLNLSGQNSGETDPVSLHLECSTEDYDQNRHYHKQILPVADNSACENIPLHMPNFLVSSPEIIKRLKSTLMEKSISSSSSLQTNSSDASSTSHLCKTTGEASRKLDFTPRDDCACIMCHGWDPSKFTVASPLDSHTSPSQELQASIDQHLHGSVSVSKQNVCSGGNTSILTVSNSTIVSSSNQGQSSVLHGDNSFFKSSTSNLVKTKAQQLHGKSLSATSIDDHTSATNQSKRTFTDSSVNAILKSQGSYYVLVPHQSLFTNSNVVLMKKSIPEIKSKDGKILYLTTDFVKRNKPDLRSLLTKTKKVDFSNAGAVSLLISDTECDVPSTFGRILTSQGNVESGQQIASMTHGRDALMQLIYSHLYFKSNPTTLRVRKTLSVPIVSRPHGDQHLNSTSKLPPPPPLFRCPSVSIPHHQNFVSAPVSQMSFPKVTVSSSSYCESSPLPVNCNNGADSTSQHLMCPTTAVTGVIASDSIYSTNVAKDFEEPREILVIPVICKSQPICTQTPCVSVINTQDSTNTAHLFTCTTASKPSPVIQSTCFQENDENSVKKSELSNNEPQKLHVPPSVSAVSTLPALNNLKSFITHIPVEPTVSPSLSHESSFKTADTEYHYVPSQFSNIESTFPSVVKVNLSSNGSCSYTSSCVPNVRNSHAASTITSSSVLPMATKSTTVSCKSDSSLQETFTLSKPILSPASLTPSSLQNLSTHSLQSNTPKSLSQPISENPSTNNAFTSTQSLPSVTCYKEFWCGSSVLSSFAGQKNLPCTNTCSSSASATATGSCNMTTAQSAAPISSIKIPSASSVEASSSVYSLTTSTSTSSVSVNGLKMKIRLGDSRSAFEMGDTKSEKCLNSSRKISSDLNALVEENTLAKRIETAEEMFQRYQEQAMQQVYNAQFGVGNISRSLRPSRSNISFIDKNIPLWRLDEGKKKKSVENNDTNKVIDNAKSSLPNSDTQSQLKVPENCKSQIKTIKKRNSTSESRSDIPEKEFGFDVNDFPKLREDHSILMKKTIFTPNIMAGHKVFVKFNVFSNPQSGRSFLIPFFNLGGSRIQFDSEDMDYIKKSVVEFEKEEKFCARHLIYFSRENKKASFVRKENFVQTNDLTDKSYKKCSYILEGFSREPAKKIIPPPEEWKLDKKVSIEIDTADVDSNVVIDFEDSLANATVSKKSVSCDMQRLKDDNVIVENRTKYSITDNHTEFEKNISYDAESRLQMSSCNVPGVSSDDFQGISDCKVHETNLHIVDPVQKAMNFQSTHTNTHSVLNEVATKDSLVHATKSSNHRPNILRKKGTPQNSNPPSPAKLSRHGAPKSPELDFESNYTDQLKELISTSSPLKSLSALKTTVRGSLPPSATNYTDQLEELFSSGNLHETIPLISKPVETHNSPALPCPSIKEEVINEEYTPTNVQSLPSCQNNLESDTHESSVMSSTRVLIKSEPVDPYYDLLERTEVAPQSPKVVQNDNQISNRSLALPKSNSHLAHDEDSKGKFSQNNMTDDDETLSAYSDSLLPSSAVSESSEISFSSCVDTSEDDSSDPLDNDDNELHASSHSFTSIVPESSPLNANVAQNSCNSKITSLVESLKQRLSEKTPAQFLTPLTEPKKQHKPKVKKKKGMKDKRMAAAESNATVSTTDSANQNTDFKKGLNLNETHFKFSLPTSSHSVPAPTSLQSASEIASSQGVSSDPHTTIKPTMDQSQSVDVGTSNLDEFRKRFPFITAAQNMNSQQLQEVNGMKNAHEQVPGDLTVQHKKSSATSTQILVEKNISCKMFDLPFCQQSLSDRFHTSAKKGAKNNETSVSTLCYAKDIESGESDIDVGTEDVIPVNLDSNLDQAAKFMSSPPLPAQRGSHLRDFSRENEFVTPKNKSGYQDKAHGNNVDGSISPKPFTLPLRPRSKTKTAQPKPTKAMPPPSTASLLCQKLDIPVESVKPKVRGKTVTPVNIDATAKAQSNVSVSTAAQEHVPKPINPGFKPSINAIFGVPDIPKAIETVINTPSSSKKSVAKKSSAKSNHVVRSKQVAIKRTAGRTKGSSNANHQKDDIVMENETNVHSGPSLSEKKTQREGDSSLNEIKNTTETKQPIKQSMAKKGVEKTAKPMLNIKRIKLDERFANKTRAGSESALSSFENHSQAIKLLTKKGMQPKAKASNVKEHKVGDEISFKTQTDSKQSSTSRQGKLSQLKKKGTAKDNMNKIKEMSVANQQKKRVITKMNARLIADSKLKSIRKTNPLNNKQKSSFANRKLGTLLIEFNRYSSLRKFAWRKYSSFKEKTYIVETGENDDIPEIVENEAAKDSGKQYIDSKEVSDGTSNTDRFDTKPCKVLVHKLEDMKFDSKEVLIKTELGSYVIKRLQDSEKRNEISEGVKKRKKKSSWKRSKKNASKPKGAKKDIVDFYAAAIESLRKKALLLEEDEKKKTEEMRLEDQLNIKEEVVKIHEMNETDDTPNAIPQEVDGKVVDASSLLDSDKFDSHESFDSSPAITDDVRFTTSKLQDGSKTVIDDIPFNSLNDAKVSEIKLPHSTQSDFSAENDGTAFISDKCLKIGERKYEGDGIQPSNVCFQVENDVNDSSNADIGINSDETLKEDKYALSKNRGRELQDIVGIRTDKDLLEGLYEQETKGDIEKCDGNLYSKENVEISTPIDEQHIVKTISQKGLECSESKMGIDVVKQVTNPGSKTCLEGCEEIVEYDESCNQSTMESDVAIGKITESLHATGASQEPRESLMTNYNSDVLSEMSVATDGSFVHKDIVLGFEDELGTETVLSKLAAEGEDEMFLLGGADDDAENIGLIPDEEVERLLGLDMKESEDGSSHSTGKNKSKETEGRTILNNSKLSWKMLPDVEGEKSAVSDHVSEKKHESRVEHLDVLTIVTHSDDATNKRDDLSPERPTLAADNQSANISPSWKRILGSRALKEIEQSVSSTIAASSANKESANNQKEKDDTLKPVLQSDKRKLKICTGALSKALKLSAEMRKTFGESTNESKSVTNKEDNKTMESNSTSHTENKDDNSDRSFFTSAKSAVASSSPADEGVKVYGLSRNTVKVKDGDTTRAIIPIESSMRPSCSPGTDGRDEQDKSFPLESRAKTAVKPLVKNVIDLTKLKMKLSPILASTKAKSTASDCQRVSCDIDNFQNNIPVFVPVTKVQKTSHSKPSTGAGAGDLHKKPMPMVNTEKLTNILKNFKKPLTLNLPSKASKMSSNLPTPFPTPESKPCSKALNTAERKAPIRKRTLSSLSANNTDACVSKRSKTNVTDISKERLGTEVEKYSEDEKGRSCFDCLSEFTPDVTVPSKKC